MTNERPVESRRFRLRSHRFFEDNARRTRVRSRMTLAIALTLMEIYFHLQCNLLSYTSDPLLFVPPMTVRDEILSEGIISQSC